MKINKKVLQEALSIVKPGLANKEIIEQTTSFAFIEGNVVTYNDEICIIHPLEINFQGVIKAEELYKFLSKVKNEEIEIKEEENQIIMKAGRARVGFSLKTELLLPLDEVLEKNEWNNLPSNFLQAIKFAASSTSKDMSNPKLTCVHITSNGVIEGTDNYRIVQWRLEEDIPIETTLIPATSLFEVIKLEPAQIAQGNGWVHFKNEQGSIISCRVFNEEYLNTDEIINSNPEEGIAFTFPEGIIELLDKAAIFAQKQKQEVNQEDVEIEVKSNFLRVNSQSESSWYKEPIKIDYKGDEFEFRITPYLLKDILTETSECFLYEDRIVFESENWVYITILK